MSGVLGALPEPEIWNQILFFFPHLLIFESHYSNPEMSLPLHQDYITPLPQKRLLAWLWYNITPKIFLLCKCFRPRYYRSHKIHKPHNQPVHLDWSSRRLKMQWVRERNKLIKHTFTQSSLTKISAERVKSSSSLWI